MTEPNQAPPLPWAGWPDEIGCNFAAGHLVRNLSPPLVVDGRLHAETLMCAAGAVAGWGAHRSLMRDPATVQLTTQLKGQLQMVTLKDGREMLYGDAINNRLMSNDPALAPRCVWNNLAGTAIGHGLTPDQLPGIDAMFGSVTARMGGPLEGLPSTPAEHQPHAPAAVLLERVLPVTLACLTGEISEITKKQNFHALETSYQIVTAWTAANILAQCSGVMPPKMALIIAMESAIYASKLTKPFHG
jgi:hypothetical protein